MEENIVREMTKEEIMESLDIKITHLKEEILRLENENYLYKSQNERLTKVIRSIQTISEIL